MLKDMNRHFLTYVPGERSLATQTPFVIRSGKQFTVLLGLMWEVSILHIIRYSKKEFPSKKKSIFVVKNMQMQWKKKIIFVFHEWKLFVEVNCVISYCYSWMKIICGSEQCYFLLLYMNENYMWKWTVLFVIVMHDR